jgi:hypothetical protein
VHCFDAFSKQLQLVQLACLPILQLVQLACSATHPVAVGVAAATEFNCCAGAGFDNIEPYTGYDSNVLNMYFNRYLPLAVRINQSLLARAVATAAAAVQHQQQQQQQ